MTQCQVGTKNTRWHAHQAEHCSIARDGFRSDRRARRGRGKHQKRDDPGAVGKQLVGMAGITPDVGHRGTIGEHRPEVQGVAVAGLQHVRFSGGHGSQNQNQTGQLGDTGQQKHQRPFKTCTEPTGHIERRRGTEAECTQIPRQCALATILRKAVVQDLQARHVGTGQRDS